MTTAAAGPQEGLNENEMETLQDQLTNNGQPGPKNIFLSWQRRQKDEINKQIILVFLYCPLNTK